MADFKIQWDEEGQHFYETGIRRGVLYKQAVSGENAGKYGEGVAWNGLTSVTESPSGAEETALYADDRKYLSLYSAEEFGGTIEAYTYPDEWEECDGSAEVTPGVTIGQQVRAGFGLCYRTVLGNDIQGENYGYKLHLIYGAKASPSQRSYATINDSPEAITLSWEYKTTPVSINITGKDYKPTSLIVIDSTQFTGEKAARLAALEKRLYGIAGDDDHKPELPSPETVIGILDGTITD